MPTSPRSIQGVVAVSDDTNVQPLGYLIWFSVPDDAVHLRTLKKTLAVNGLPPTLAPKDTKAIHTFKRAMREQEGRKRDNGHIIETTVALVEETMDDCVYQISRLKRDLNERVVDYPKAMRVVFNKGTEELSFNPLKGVPVLETLPMEEEITSFYEQNATKVTGARVRGVIRNFIRDEPDEARDIDGLSGENLRGKAGGIYFVPAKHAEQVKALSEFLHELYKGKGYLHAVPLADGASERDLVRRHHVANTRAEMLEAITEVKGLLAADRERAPRSDVVANQWARFKTLQRRSAEYKRILEDESEEIQDMGAILKKQLDRLD